MTQVTEEDLTFVAKAYARAWESLVEASGAGTGEYPLEAHAAHLLARSIEQRCVASLPILEAYYWTNGADGDVENESTRTGRADVWVPANEASELFVEIKLAGLWRGIKDKVGQRNVVDTKKCYENDVSRLRTRTRRPIRFGPLSSVNCAFMVVAMGDNLDNIFDLKPESYANEVTSRRCVREFLASLVDSSDLQCDLIVGDLVGKDGPRQVQCGAVTWVLPAAV